MQYDDFISSVQARGGRPRDETETLVHATLRVLAERVLGIHRDAALPSFAGRPFHSWAKRHRGPAGGTKIVYFHNCGRMAALPRNEARDGMVAVLATTRDAVEPGEFDDVLSQLGREFEALMAL